MYCVSIGRRGPSVVTQFTSELKVAFNFSVAITDVCTFIVVPLNSWRQMNALDHEDIYNNADNRHKPKI